MKKRSLLQIVATGCIFLCAAIVPGCNYNSLSEHELYEKGRQHLSGGNIKGATLVLRKVLEKDPNYFEARYLLGLAYIQDEKYEQAIKELYKTLKLNPSYNQAHVALAKAYAGVSKIDDAEKQISTYLQDHGDDAEACAVAAAVYAAKKDYAKADEYLNESLRFSPQKISSRILLSEVYLSLGKVREAEKLIQEVIAADRGNRKALHVLTKIRQTQGRDEDAADIYYKLIKKEPRDITSYFELALTYFKMDQIEKAGEVIELLEKNSNKCPEVPFLRGLKLYYEGKIDDAIVFLKKSAGGKKIASTCYYLGLCYLDKGRDRAAITEFQEVIDHRPFQIQPRLLIALLYLKNGLPEKTVIEAKKALQVDARNAFAHNLLGSAYFALGRGDAALEEFNKTVDFGSDIVEAHLGKTPFHMLSEDVRGLENEFLSTVKIDSDLLNGRIIIAISYMKNNKYQDALLLLQDSLKGGAGDAAIYNIMGKIYLDTRADEKAKQCFMAAKSLETDFKDTYLNVAKLNARMSVKTVGASKY